jgi:hypothetical protein
MTSLELCKLLNLNRIRAYDFGVEGLISIFDDEHYSNSDYDILDPNVRADVRRVLIADEWSSKSSKVFEKNGVQIKFPSPSHTLGCNPADKILESLEEGAFCIVTPTQALLASISLNKWEFEKAQKLVVYHPANLSKIWNWISNEQSVHVPREDIAALKVIQKAGFELRKKGEQNLYPCKKMA